MGPARVLLVDDDQLFIRRIQRALNDDVDLHIATTTRDALLKAATWQPDVVVVDPLLSDVESGALLDCLPESWNGSIVSVICLSRGAGALTRYQTLGESFYGTVRREAGAEGVCAALRLALASDICS